MRILALGILCFLSATIATATSLSPQRTLDRVYVAVNGTHEATGSLEDPLSFGAALQRRPHEIVVRGGLYRVTESHTLTSEWQGSAEDPFIIRAADGEHVVFDGSLPLQADRFKLVSNSAERNRLAASAVDQVIVQTLSDPEMIHQFESELILGLVIDGNTHFPARFPNEGYAQLHHEAVKPEISPPAVPVGKEDYGVRAGHPPFQEEGRRQGWLGSMAEPRGAWARFADRGDEMAGTWQQWQDEIARDPQRNRLTGFLDANWLQKSQGIVAADAATQSIHLSQALAYGRAWKNKDKPFHVSGLLCELDAPGEWHYDRKSKRLFLYPPDGFGKKSEISIPLATGFIKLDGCKHVQFIGLHVRNLAGGTAYDLNGGSNNLIASASVRNSTASGVRVTGSHQRVLGCDFVDLNRHVSLSGGRRGPGLLESGHNLVENCHIYQEKFTHQRVGISISGVDNRFRHNLIHNSLGQAVTIRGNGHLLEFNELFNIGFDEGDGGAMYAGGDLSGYGVTYRHNFFHHLMHVPGKVERSGIHLDDLQAGSICIGNVFYKSAGKGIFMNGGAGHRVEDNVFLDGYRGVYNVGHGAQKNHDRQEAAFDPSDDYHNTKENYVGRVERLIGSQGWNEEPWSSTYPLFAQVMNDEGQFGRMWPIRCTVRNNWFYGNARDDRTIWSRVAPEAAAKSIIAGDRVLDPSVFVNYETLDLRIRQGTESAPQLPFERIGLYRNEHRQTVPDKAAYRRAIRAHFDGIPCMPGTTKRYDSSAALLES